MLVEFGTRINSGLLAEVFDLGQHGLDVLAVGLEVSPPLAPDVRVLHQVQPQFVIVLLGDDQHHCVDLELGTFSSTGSKEQVSFETRFLGVDQGVPDAEVKVDSFKGECSDAGEPEASSLEAIEGALSGDNRRSFKADEAAGWQGEQEQQESL